MMGTDTITILMENVRLCDLSCILRGHAAHKWQHANEYKKKLVWERVRLFVEAEKQCGRNVDNYHLNYFIDLECDDIFYDGLPRYIVRVYKDEQRSIESQLLRQTFTGQNANQMAMWYSRMQDRAGFFTRIDELLKEGELD